jgi:transposase
MDCSSIGRVSVSKDRHSPDTAVAFGTSPDARDRVAQDQANDSKSPESRCDEAGPEGPPAAKKGALEAGADYELWFADGVRFELLPVTTYTYRRRGHPLRIPTPGKNARTAVCGAYRWPNGPFLFTHGPKCVNTALFIGMVQMLESRARRTGKRIVLVIDNGSAHTSKRSLAEIERVQSAIRVFWLPTYTSEQLNDIEGVWKHLKEDYFSRMLVEKRETFTDAVVKLLRTMRRGQVLRQMLRPCHTRRAVRKNLTKVA